MFKFGLNRFEGFNVDYKYSNGSPIHTVQDCNANPFSLSLSSSFHAQRYQSLSLRCHGNFLPTTYLIFTCVFVLVYLSEAEFRWYSPWDTYNRVFKSCWTLRHMSNKPSWDLGLLKSRLKGNFNEKQGKKYTFRWRSRVCWTKGLNAVGNNLAKNWAKDAILLGNICLTIYLSVFLL